ncbi:MAG TPA: S8 family serine peptidase [Caulobacter sp.]|nr:S8 family serine peptidase [Caulobacter sp.]
MRGLEKFPRQRQTETFAPQFNRLAEVLNRDAAALELRADPAALAPERLLVFEVRGSIGAFANAIRNVPGLELIDEEELGGDEGDKAPVAYLLVPDIRALRELESLWRRWQSGQLRYGETPWRDVFELLRDLRPWGPQDRVQPLEANYLMEEIDGRDDGDLVRIEIELVFRANAGVAQERQAQVLAAVAASGGRAVSTSKIDDIAYHAVLVDLPVPAVRDIIARRLEGLAGLEPIMHIRPQSLASSIEIEPSEGVEGPQALGALGAPILALLDGVPVAAHRLLAAHLVVDDQLGLEANSPVADRVHGTAMASLIVHGDRNRGESPLPRQIHVVPVLGARDGFPADRLIVDVIYSAVIAMVEGPAATAPQVLIVNLSLGNSRRPFHGQLSAWSRLLDRLAHRYGLLFVVSAGNCREAFAIPAFANNNLYEDAAPGHRATETLRALGSIVGDRRLFSPAETVNGLTVGAYNDDAVSAADRLTARVNVDPWGERQMANPSSALGPGFALSVKPDVLLPGSKERLRLVRTHDHIEVGPAGPARSAGLKVAAPPRDGRENQDGYTNGTSAAAALASRTAHRIHDALEAAYGPPFTDLPKVQRAALLKALTVHPARWPAETAALIRGTIGPADGRLHVQQKDNIRRFLGFGMVDPEDAVACAEDRATFWATGLLQPNKIAVIDVPVPLAMAGQARAHAVFATLAWFTPTSPGRRSYRSVRLKLLEPTELGALAVKAHGNQPDGNQTNRGTLFARCWQGDKAPAIRPDMTFALTVQRDPDQGAQIDDAISFGLAVTVTMPGIVEVYEQVRQRLAIPMRQPV